MAEHDNKERILPGDTSVSHSSDEYITDIVNQMQEETDGVNNTVLDGDAFAPKLSGSATAVTNYDTDHQPVADFAGLSSGFEMPAQVNPNKTDLYSLSARIKRKKYKPAA